MLISSSESALDSLYCQFCKAIKLQQAFFARDRHHRVDDRLFDVIRCPSCGLGYTYPKLSLGEIEPYYPLKYYNLDKSLHIESLRHTRRHRKIRLRRIRRYVSSGLLIDIGAGTGMFLKSACEHGFQVEGLEISKEAAEFGRLTWNLNIKQGNLHETSFPNNHYDVVTLSHVF